MARKYIGWTSRGPAVYRNIRKDRTGDPLIEIDDTEIVNLVLDLAAYLDTGETISSVTTDSESCTISITLASPIITVTLSSATSYEWGCATLYITLSSGEAIKQQLRVRRPNKFSDEAALCDYII